MFTFTFQITFLRLHIFGYVQPQKLLLIPETDQCYNYCVINPKYSYVIGDTNTYFAKFEPSQLKKKIVLTLHNQTNNLLGNNLYPLLIFR